MYIYNRVFGFVKIGFLFSPMEMELCTLLMDDPEEEFITRLCCGVAATIVIMRCCLQMNDREEEFATPRFPKYVETESR